MTPTRTKGSPKKRAPETKKTAPNSQSADPRKPSFLFSP